MNDEKEKEQNMRVSFKKTMSITALTLVMTFAPPSQAFFLMIAEAIAAAVEAVKTSQTVIRVTRTVNNVVKGVKAVQSVIKKKHKPRLRRYKHWHVPPFNIRPFKKPQQILRFAEFSPPPQTITTGDLHEK
jgi:hypothetical protein